MNPFDAAKIALAQVKDRLREDTFNQLVRSYMETLEAEADARRSKTACDILRMSRLKISLQKLEYNYLKVKELTGAIPDLENMIMSVKKEIKVISLMKNH